MTDMWDSEMIGWPQCILKIKIVKFKFKVIWRRLFFLGYLANKIQQMTTYPNQQTYCTKLMQLILN